MDPAWISSGATYVDELRFELIEEPIKDESTESSPPQVPDQLPIFKSSSTPIPSTETEPLDLPDAPEPDVPEPDAPEPNAPEPKAPEPSAPETTAATPGAATALKKKGIASTIKRVPKRPKGIGGGGESKKPKKAKSAPGSEANSTAAEDASEEDDDESDNGPYCICRGPDDHRWMICCEKCEDWFHGECVHITKEIGENLIEKFICPNCSVGELSTIYKKTCSLPNCRKAARLTQTPSSVFCSNEHAQIWWERMIARLPKTKARAALGDELTQEELMALLNSDLAALDGDGVWKLKTPFSENHSAQVNGNDTTSDERLLQILTEEEKEYLDSAANTRFKLAEETLLCHKMLSLIEMVQERRRAAISSSRFTGEEICGYDSRLDTICARDAFAAFLKSPDGEAIFHASKVDDPLGEGDEARGMCERKRCKVHGGWQKMLVLGIRHQIREMADQAADVGEEEKILREAAEVRWRRRQAERNWVEVLNG